MIKCLYCGQNLSPLKQQIMDPKTGFTKPCTVMSPLDHFEKGLCPIINAHYRTYEKVQQFCRGNPALRKLFISAMAIGKRYKKLPELKLTGKPKKELTEKEKFIMSINVLVKALDELDRMELLPEVEDG